MQCILCGTKEFKTRPGVVRDDPKLSVLECLACGLVSLSSKQHISTNFYQDSGMHGDEVYPIEMWLRDTEKDDLRRFNSLKECISNSSLLDFGCGAGGFLRLAHGVATRAVGVELEKRVIDHWQHEMSIIDDLYTLDEKFDIITAFHVFEHLIDPIASLRKLATYLKPGGRIVIEVPNANDILLQTYQSVPFSQFTYWSQHIHLFNANNMNKLANLAGLKCITTKHLQRYPLSNHLHWLAKGNPGGHHIWNFLDSNDLSSAYESVLASIGQTDTIISYITHED